MSAKRWIRFSLSFAIVFSGSADASGTTVWPADDGHRIGPNSLPHADAAAISDDGISLFALAGETIAFQIAIRSGDEPLQNVTIDVEALDMEGKLPIDESWVERFIVFPILAPSLTRNGWSNDDETLGWATVEAKPEKPTIAIPDALIPIEWAPAWAPYPLRVPTDTTMGVWLDIFIPPQTPSGQYHGLVRVNDDRNLIVDLPLEIDVKKTNLPFRAVKTAIFYDPLSLEQRIGPGQSELELWRLLHRHQLTPMLSADDVRELERIRLALDGSAYRREHGYRGPGEDIGDDLLVLGAYGSLGEPSASSLARVHEMMRALEELPGARTVFLYAIDESCENQRAARWQHALRQTRDPLLTSLRVGETCHHHPSGRAADLLMLPSSAFRPDDADEARAAGKWIWVYNGQRPRSGPMMLDAPPLDLRANGWIGSAFEIDRWFYWESTFWKNTNSGGRGPIDPFVIADSFHNAGGDIALGDGLLVYPGRQLSFPAHSIGKDSVLPSIRLKNLRRGIQDAGYVALVASRNPRLAESIVHSVVPSALDEIATERTAPSWPLDAAAFVEARRALWNAIDDDAGVDEVSKANSLRKIARARYERRLDRLPETAASAPLIMLFTAVAAIWAARRSSTNRRALARYERRLGSREDETKTFP